MLRTLTLWCAALLCGMPSAAAAGGPAHNSVVLLLDASGSMKKTDPRCVRGEAATLLLNLLEDGDRVALLEFGDPRPGELGVLRVLDGKTRDALMQQAGACAASDQKTDLLDALRRALALVDSIGGEGRAAFPPAVILLTDGMDDPPTRTPDRSERVDAVLRDLAARGARVHGVGLSPQADRSTLQRFETLTGGNVVYVDKDRDLLGAFLSISRALGGRWLLRDGPAEAGEGSVEIPPWSQRVVVAFFPAASTGERLKIEGALERLVRPSIQIYSVDNAAAGQLRVRVPSPGGRLVVDAQGDLVLVPTIPKRVPLARAFPCQVRMTWSGIGGMGRATFLEAASARVEFGHEKTSVGATYLYDDGKHSDGAALDGLFGGTCMVPDSGSVPYRVVISTPFSPTLSATGEVEAPESFISVIPPGGTARALASALPRVLAWEVTNSTDLPLILWLEAGDTPRSDSVELPARGSVSLTLPSRRSWLTSTSTKISLFTQGDRKPIWSGEIFVPPGLTLPVCGLAVLLLIASGWVFPRRSAAGRLRIEYRPRGADDPSEIQLVDIAADGRFARPEKIPDPFDQPGAFRGRHGFWRRGGVLFVPNANLQPQFRSSSQPRRTSRGLLIARSASWSTNGPDGTAQYSYTRRK